MERRSATVANCHGPTQARVNKVMRGDTDVGLEPAGTKPTRDPDNPITGTVRVGRMGATGPLRPGSGSCLP